MDSADTSLIAAAEALVFADAAALILASALGPFKSPTIDRLHFAN